MTYDRLNDHASQLHEILSRRWYLPKTPVLRLVFMTLSSAMMCMYLINIFYVRLRVVNCRTVSEQTSRISINIPLISSKAEDVVVSTYAKHYTKARRTDERIVRELLERNAKNNNVGDNANTEATGEDSPGTVTSCHLAEARPGSANTQATGEDSPGTATSRHLAEARQRSVHSDFEGGNTPSEAAAASSLHSQVRDAESDAGRPDTVIDVTAHAHHTENLCGTASHRSAGASLSQSSSANASGAREATTVRVAAETTFESYEMPPTSPAPFESECSTDGDKSRVLHGYVARRIFEEGGVSVDEQRYIFFGDLGRRPETLAKGGQPADAPTRRESVSC